MRLFESNHKDQYILIGLGVQVEWLVDGGRMKVMIVMRRKSRSRRDYHVLETKIKLIPSQFGLA
jgi:hypothetical protein